MNDHVGLCQSVDEWPCRSESVCHARLCRSVFTIHSIFNWATGFSSQWTNWATGFSSQWTNWATGFSSQWTNWATGFSSQWTNWATGFSSQWTNWVTGFSSQWTNWATGFSSQWTNTVVAHQGGEWFVVRVVSGSSSGWLVVCHQGG